ncbi:ribokinase [Herbaspirillum huttiense]|jgi:ribokinase|uniref:Ribokinase n=3 Tax=Herbaspirillum huttiense TaxID=863372 RepID=A0AAJ2HDK4_9BURK|nr:MULTISPECIES: ribokinase [Herbaspirillum]MBN9357116.1 ribokinase [Herbaspirillum huttiense]MBP1315304.1 ribokinase [Herbaspirillum sp. 1130]MCO4859192.1 ribokinase [Herbaspirillum sp. WGmk3]MDR6741135.1 ribokinase [Herbaspirillum sp. 1173]MDR9838466.1 ribokinase [Herbaspirillum huttiense]
MTSLSHKTGVAVLGIYVADLAFRAPGMPGLGQTIAGTGFAMGPGGKGSNQAVAAARVGAPVRFISAIGKDSFGDFALSLWRQETIAPHVRVIEDAPTGAAFIYVNDASGDNAIIVVPGAASQLSTQDVEREHQAIEAASVFVTQLEQPPEAALTGLQIARAAGTTTVFNPAPALDFPPQIYGLCDFITPNEHEAALLTGIEIHTVDDARRAADVLLERGVGCALITLGAQGALLHSRSQSLHLPALCAGTVVETAGAGDAFNGAFAAGLAEGMSAEQAARLATAVAAISVTRPGTAPSMPSRQEALALLQANAGALAQAQ